VTAAIILAAGASTRMGSPKALLPFRSSNFLGHLTGRLALHCSPVIVVAGAHLLPASPAARLVINPQWPEGQLSSLQCGLRALPPGVSSVLFTLVDHPDPADGTIVSLLRSPRLIAIPVHEGRRGHPVFFQAPLIPELLALAPAESAKQVFSRHARDTEYITVDDPAVTDDVDDPEALALFRRRTNHA